MKADNQINNIYIYIEIKNKSRLIFKACLVILGILTIMCRWYSILLIVFCMKATK